MNNNQYPIYYDYCWKVYLSGKISSNKLDLLEIEQLFNNLPEGELIINNLGLKPLSQALQEVNVNINKTEEFILIKFQHYDNFYHILEIIDFAKVDINKYLMLL